MFFLNRLLNKSNIPNNNENDKILLSKRLSTLTTQVLAFMLLREGFSKKECSQRLGLTRRDINKHIKLIYRKLGVRTNAELIMIYKEADMVKY